MWVYGGNVLSAPFVNLFELVSFVLLFNLFDLVSFVFVGVGTVETFCQLLSFNLFVLGGFNLFDSESSVFVAFLLLDVVIWD